MKFLENTKKTRFKITLFACLFLSGVALYSLYKEAYDLSGQAIAALMVIIPIYIGGDSYRKS